MVPPMDTPLEVNVKHQKDHGDLLSDPTFYRHLVGGLVCLTITRTDISYAVHVVSQFMTALRHHHLVAAKRIIQYILGSPTCGLFFLVGTPLWCRLGRMPGYSQIHHRLVCIWVNHSFLGNAKGKKGSQNLPLNLSIVLCLLPVPRLRRLLTDFGFPQTSAAPLHTNNTISIRITENHEHTKHIEVDCHFIRDEYDHQVIILAHISSELQLANFFTKGLPRPCHEFLVRKLLLFDQHQFKGGC